MVACTDGHIRLIDPELVKVTQDIPAIDGWAYSLAVHPTDGSVVIGGPNGQVRRVIIDAIPRQIGIQSNLLPQHAERPKSNL